MRIVLEARNADDVQSILEKVEEVFRPTDLEINVVDSSTGQLEEDVSRRMAIEPLETAANAAAGKRLDTKEESARKRTEAPSVSPKEVQAEQTRQREWVRKARGFGWLVIRVAVEILQGVV